MSFSFSRLLIWLRNSILLLLGHLLSGCYEWQPLDPVCCHYTSLKPAYPWVPSHFRPMVCNNSYREEDERAFEGRRLDLADLIDIALQNNPLTQETWANAQAAAYAVGVSKSHFYPQINLQEVIAYQDCVLDDPCSELAVAAASGGQTVSGSGEGSNITLNSHLSLSYLLLDFGGRRALLKSAYQALYISDWTHNYQIQQTILSVLQSYYHYIGTRALLRAKEADVENSRVNLEAAQQLYGAGLRTKLDVLQTQADLVNAELNLIDLQGQENIARGILVSSLGIPGTTRLNIPDFPENAPLDRISVSLDELIAMAKEQRPDLAAAYANHEQKRADIIVARSGGLPKLTLDANIYSNLYFHHSYLNNHIYTGGLTLTIPFFNGFFYDNQTRQARELLRAACAEVRRRELGVILDVITEYYHYQTAVASFKHSEEYLKYSEETYQAALINYRQEMGTILDLLAAQQTLANARAQKVQAHVRWALALANIAFATGVLGIQCPSDVEGWPS